MMRTERLLLPPSARGRIDPSLFESASGAREGTLASSGYFVRQFLRAPRQTGAIAASSAALCRELVDLARTAEAETVVERGTGSGGR